MIRVYTAVFNSDLEEALRNGCFEFQNPCQTGQLHEWVDEAFDMLKPEGVNGRQQSAIMPLMTEDQAHKFSWLTGAAVLEANLPPEVAVREGAYTNMLMQRMLRGKTVFPQEILALANPYWRRSVMLGDFAGYVLSAINNRGSSTLYAFVDTHTSPTNFAMRFILRPEVLLPEGAFLYEPRVINSQQRFCTN